MAIKALKAEIARLKAEVEKENSPGNRHALSLLEARTEGLVTHVNTPQRGTPFFLELVGMDAGKEVREMAGLGFVTSSKVVLPAHDGSLCILPGHAPMVGLLGHGELVVTSRAARIPSNKQLDRTFEIKEGTEYRMYVSGGTFQVMDNEVLILPEQGFLPTQLRLDDLELEENRQAAQVRASEENLEGESLNAMFLEAKKKEVAELRKSTETLKPSTEKEAEMNRIRAMEKVLG